MSNALVEINLPDDGEIPPTPLNVRLSMAREWRKRSRADMSRALGRSVKTITRYEQGEYVPARGFVLGWAMALNVSARWLLGEEYDGENVPGSSPGPDVTGGQRWVSNPIYHHAAWFRWLMRHESMLTTQRYMGWAPWGGTLIDDLYAA